MRSEFQAAIAQLIAEKGLPREVVMETVATALLAAYRKSFGGGENVRIEVDKNGEVHVWAAKRVVALRWYSYRSPRPLLHALQRPRPQRAW